MHQRVPHNRQSGVGFIEILVTMFVLAIGLLGVASLQFVGSFANRDAISRTQSELVAEQVSERLRAASRPPNTGDGMVVNNDYFDAGNYNFSSLSCNSGDVYECHCLTRPADVPNCEAGVCTEAQMAAYDGWALSCSAVQTNRDITLEVSCTDNNGGDGDVCSAGSRIHITLKWPVASTSKQQYTLNARCNPNSGDKNACVAKDITL